jgi:arylsulfatase A-like enzyme
MFGPLLVTHFLSLPWMLWIILLASLVVFRGVFTADMAAAIDVKDIPLFKFCVDYYGTIYWGTMALGGLHVVLSLLVYRDSLGVDPLRRTSMTSAALKLSIGSTLILLLSAIGCRYQAGATSDDLILQGTNLWDWALVLLVPAATHWVLVVISHADDDDDTAAVVPAPLRIAPAGVVTRLGLIYLLGCAAVLAFAVEDHYRFWDPELNNNYHYRQFFASEAEVDQAKLVFVSTSLLFASLAAVAGCAGWLVLRLASRNGKTLDSDSNADSNAAALRRQVLVIAALWAIVLMVPWQVKLRDEIVAEQGWIMPAVTLLFTIAALSPMLLACRMMMQRDFDWCLARRHGSALNSGCDGLRGLHASLGDFTLWTTLLFPIYPLLRGLRTSPPGMFWLTLTTITGMVVVQLSWLANHASQMFTFDDWRGMLKESQFPFFQVMCSLLVAWMVFSFIRLLARGGADLWYEWTKLRDGFGHVRSPSLVRFWHRLLATESLALMLAGTWRLSMTEDGWTKFPQQCASLSENPFQMWELFASGSLAQHVTSLQGVGHSLPLRQLFGIAASLLLPFLIAAVIYLYGRAATGALTYLAGHAPTGRFATSSLRVAERFGRIASAAVVSTAALLVALSATWPFWGWQNVSPNVFARAIEFNDRHIFELKFLHWVFDADRDGYAAVLHGADPNDFDAQIQAGGIGPPTTTAVPIDEFEIVDKKRAANVPNVVIFYLEGVVPRSISAYGQRNLPNGLIATPHMDSVAADGTLFRQARCFYPSTWDAWFAVSSGRFLYVAEMTSSGATFSNRYSRYNNLYKVLNLCGISRWCHGDISPYRRLYVPPEMRGEGKPTDWKPATDDYNTALTDEQEHADYWRGDNRNQRMLEFIDDLKPGEKFFICEHMTDTHFPWNRTNRERAIELGFPDGLEPYEADARLPDGRQYDQFSRYYQTITRMDGQIGQILDKLKERELYEDTMIVIVSDHGCQWWEHEHQYYVEHLYEQSIRIPLIIKAPGLPAGKESDAPVQQIDILPTVMEVAGVRLANPSEDHPLIGRSLVPLMRGEQSAEVLARYRQRDIPLKTHYDTIGLLSQSRYKLIFERPTGTYLLFDLLEDPGEMRNLATDRPELLADMLHRLRQQIQQKPAFLGQIER